MTLILGACGPQPAEPPTAVVHRTPEEVRHALREAMIRQDHCYMENLDFAIRDPDFLDQVMADLLGRKTLEEVADDPREFDELIRLAPGSYVALMNTEDGLDRLSRVVSEHFGHPVVTTGAQTVRADYGHIAARFSRGLRGSLAISCTDSPHLENGCEWRSVEVAAALKGLYDRYPDVMSWEVRVVIPYIGRASEWIYTYRLKTDAITVTLSGPLGRHYYSDRINRDFGPLVRGEASLNTRSLHPTGH